MPKTRKPKLSEIRSQTRRLYRLEEEFFRGEPLFPMSTLRKVAKRIWKKSGRSVSSMPKISAGRGDPYNGRLYSYFDGEKIVLARNERKKFVLAHELAHALGHDLHDLPFVRGYLRTVSRCHPEKTIRRLVSAALEHGVLPSLSAARVPYRR